MPASLFSEAELESLSFACGLSSEQHDGNLYFFFGEIFSEEGEDSEGVCVNCLKVFEDKLRTLDPVEYPYITIEGAATCDKMRHGEFGGFAYFITRDEERYVSTWQWLHQQTL